MNKPIVIGAVIAVLGGGGLFAMSSIADGKVKALYNKPQLGMLHNIQATPNLGFMGGTVEWTADLVFDACKPDEKITLKGTDTVSKGLTGYTIKSEFKPVVSNESVQNVLNKMPNIQLESKINWSGNGHSTLLYPAHELSEQTATLKWDSLTGKFKFSNQGDKLTARDLQFNLPSVSLKTNEFSTEIKGFSYESDLPLGYQLDTGKGQFKVQSITANEAKSNMTLENFTVNVEQIAKAETVDAKVNYTLGTLELKNENTTTTLQDAKIGFDILDLNRKSTETLLSILEQSTQQCTPPEKLVDTIEPHVLNIANSGLRIESKNNQVKVGNSIATANMEITAPKSSYSSMREVVQLLPNQVSYKLDVEFDKSFVKNLYSMINPSRTLNEKDFETGWQQLILVTQATVNGDRLKIVKTSENAPATPAQ